MTWLSSVRTLREAEQVPTLGVPASQGCTHPPNTPRAPQPPRWKGVSGAAREWCRAGAEGNLQ